MDQPPSPRFDALSAVAAAVQQGQDGAADDLVRLAGPAVLRVVRQILGTHHPDVPDVAQDALLSVLDALPRFRFGCSVSHFIWRVAALTAMNARRRLMLRERLTQSGVETDALPAQRSSPYDQVAHARHRQAFLRMLDELPQAQSEVLLLHVVLGYTVAEIAEAMQIPLNTVRSRLLSAKAVLRQYWQEHPELVELAEGAS